jgi:hypothetical protein
LEVLKIDETEMLPETNRLIDNVLASIYDDGLKAYLNTKSKVGKTKIKKAISSATDRNTTDFENVLKTLGLIG